MSLQRRLLIYLLICAPLVWGAALWISIAQARHEVNELFDTQLIRLARQVCSTLGPTISASAGPAPLPAPVPGSQAAGDADLHDLAVAVWDRQGRLVLADREGVLLPRPGGAGGFVDRAIDGRAWRIYYMPSANGEWQVAAGQGAYERDELVYGLTLAQVIPWILVLPVLLTVMAWAVRRALSPMNDLATELQGRGADDLRPVPAQAAPAELRPMLAAMNGLFARIGQLLVRERRFTADAAHELRTPLAVLSAQWDVVRRSGNAAERAAAEDKLSAGIERMGRLVTQMLSLSRLESGARPVFNTEVAWRPIVEQAMSDCLSLAERRRIELACEWPLPGTHPLPVIGDEHLLTVMLRNLLDNAIRYAPVGTAVMLRIGSEHLEIENAGPPLTAQQIERLGERFYRPEGQQESGSGLGISIVRTIARLHGLELSFGVGAGGQGVRAVLRFAELPPGRPSAV